MAESVISAFNSIAHEYDHWYEGNPLFESELMALSSVCEVSEKSLEVGVGSGRFARSLGIRMGLDPALEPLRIAYSAGILAIQGAAESLPFQSQSLDQIYFIFSLCFIRNQTKALEEARRVLVDGGTLIAGIIPRESSWGAFYTRKAASGQSIYRFASFRTVDSWTTTLRQVGFDVTRSVSTLRCPPDESEPRVELPQRGVDPKAGFVVLLAKKRGT